jgi:glyoxylate/hydroxypyruvate reductase
LTRLLIYEASFDRLKAELAALGGGLVPVVMDAEGRRSIAGVEVAAGDVAADAAGFNVDVFESPAAGAFMSAVLKSPTLKWVQSAAAGFDHPVFGRIVENGVRLTTSHGQAIGISEYVLAGVLDHFHNGPQRRAAQVEGIWRRTGARELMDSSWLVIGFGAIGQAVAQRAGAFGASVIGVRRDPAAHPLAERIVSLGQVREHLPVADVVVLCAPLSPATRHLADAGFFAAMKAGSVLVNVGRGPLVDEAALLEALDRGLPAHAVLDVFENEPLPAESRLWSHSRASVTAHDSGVTGGQNRRNEQLFLENLARFLTARPLLNEAAPGDVLGKGRGN